MMMGTKGNKGKYLAGVNQNTSYTCMKLPIKYYKMGGTGEVAQQLRKLVALPEHLNFVLTTHIMSSSRL